MIDALMEIVVRKPFVSTSRTAYSECVRAAYGIPKKSFPGFIPPLFHWLFTRQKAQRRQLSKLARTRSRTTQRNERRNNA